MSQPNVMPDIEALVTEDDTPVDNMPSEKQQRLLTEPLYSSWEGPGAGRYERQASPRFPDLGLGLTLWDGVFEAVPGTWLRWTDAHGVVVPTGKELAERAEQERQRAEQERQRAEQVEELLVRERQRAERLAALLRRSGIDPEQG